MSANPSILSTKTLGTDARELIRSMGWALREEDFIDTRALPHADYVVPPEALVIFTSAKSIEYLSEGGFWPIACLSGQTQIQAQRTFSQEQIIYTAPSARELAGVIIEDARFREAVFFCAREHRPELPEMLREKGIQLTEVPVYETLGRPKVIDTPYDAVLFFSPSGVDNFFQQNHLPNGAVCFAIGETTAESIKDYTDERIIASDAPTQDALLRCVQFYYDKQQRYE